MIYLDNHSTTKTDKEVLIKMWEADDLFFGNYSSNHGFWYRVQEEVRIATAFLKDLINAEDDSIIIFTSWATESNNLVINSFWAANNHIISTQIEHKCILNALNHCDADFSLLEVNSCWFVDLNELERHITNKTKLVSIIMANNEIWSIQDTEHIWKSLKETGIVFHVDAAQAIWKIHIDVQKDHISLLSWSAHKFYWPKWIWFLYIKNKEILKQLKPLLYWGGQQFGLRSWTLNSIWIIWMWEAARIAKRDLSKNQEYYTNLRDSLYSKLSEINWFTLNWPLPGNQRLPNNLNFFIQSLWWQDWLKHLTKKFAVSSWSACNSSASSISHVLDSIWLNEEQCSISIRIGIGKYNTIEETDAFYFELKKIIDTMK